MRVCIISGDSTLRRNIGELLASIGVEDLAMQDIYTLLKRQHRFRWTSLDLTDISDSGTSQNCSIDAYTNVLLKKVRFTLKRIIVYLRMDTLRR